MSPRQVGAVSKGFPRDCWTAEKHRGSRRGRRMQTKNLGHIHGRRIKPTRGRRRCRRATVESQVAICVNELHRAEAFRDFLTVFANIGLIYPTMLRLRASAAGGDIYCNGRPNSEANRSDHVDTLRGRIPWRLASVVSL